MRRNIIGIFLGLIFLLAVGFRIKEDFFVDHTLPKPSFPSGFTLLFEGKDINCLLLEQKILVSGADGIYSYDPATGEEKQITDYSYVYQIARIPEGLVAATGKGVHLIKSDGSVQSDFFGEDLIGEKIRCLVFDRRGYLWAGGFVGLYCLETEESFTVKDGLSDNSVDQALQLEDGTWFFGSYVAPRGGLTIVKPNGEVQVFTVEQGLPHPNITSITELKDGRVFVGGGLYIRGGGVLLKKMGDEWEIAESITKEKDGLAGEKIRSIFQDRSGEIWVGSEYDGLVRDWRGKSTIWTKEQELSNNEVKCIEEDESYLWIGTHRGLMRINKEVIYDD